VIEPERLLDAARLPPARVDLAGADIGGQKPYFDDRLGRFATFTALRAYNSDEEAGLGARGWKGDRLLACAAPDHERDHALWQTLWITREDARAFFKAMHACLLQRYDAKPSSDEPGRTVLQALNRHVRLVINRDGLGVRLVDAATAAFADAAVQAP
jgi:hypothetical protein